MKISRVWKAIIAAAGTLAIALTEAVGDNILSMDDTVKLLVMTGEVAVTVFGVYKARNAPDTPRASAER